MSDHQQDHGDDAEFDQASGRLGEEPLNVTVFGGRLFGILIFGAIGFWIVTNASNSLESAVASEKAAKAEESRQSNPWAKD